MNLWLIHIIVRFGLFLLRGHIDWEWQRSIDQNIAPKRVKQEIPDMNFIICMHHMILLGRLRQVRYDEGDIRTISSQNSQVKGPNYLAAYKREEGFNLDLGDAVSNVWKWFSWLRICSNGMPFWKWLLVWTLMIFKSRIFLIRQLEYEASTGGPVFSYMLVSEWMGEVLTEIVTVESTVQPGGHLREAAHPSEMSVNTYQTTRHHIPAVRIPNLTQLSPVGKLL
jgi:hypothetical protein